jgi:hypothetical protein
MTEKRFILPFYEDQDRVIELSGAIDYVDLIPRDWKTSGSGMGYEKWELQRWNIQATVYTWAAMMLGLVDPVPHSTGEHQFPFEFVVMGGKAVKRVTITRTEADWSWLQDKVIRLAKLIESGLDPWPVNDNHALCSPKWCPAWDDCKGSHGIEY